MSEISSKRKLLTFLFFFVLASVLWFLNSLNQYYKTTVKLAILLENPPKEKAILKKNIRTLYIKVHGYGYELLRYTLTSKLKPLTINLSKIALQPIKPGDTKHYYFLTSEIEKQISSQLSQKIKILDIKPDTLFLNFITLYSKIVGVKSRITIKYQKQFINKTPVKITPTTVKVLGPSYILDTLKYVETQKVVFNNVHSNIDTLINLVSPPKVKLTPNQIKLSVQVEQYTEVSIQVPLHALNVPPNYSLKLFPNQITIKYLVGFSNYNKISPANFFAAVNYFDLKNNPGDKLPVHIIHAPKQIYSYQYTPAVVDYILEQKQ